MGGLVGLDELLSQIKGPLFRAKRSTFYNKRCTFYNKASLFTIKGLFLAQFVSKRSTIKETIRKIEVHFKNGPSAFYIKVQYTCKIPFPFYKFFPSFYRLSHTERVFSFLK